MTAAVQQHYGNYTLPFTESGVGAGEHASCQPVSTLSWRALNPFVSTTDKTISLLSARQYAPALVKEITPHN